MESEEGTQSRRPSRLEEDAHFFDFQAFFKRPEFCDRVLRLEVLDECRTVGAAANASEGASNNTAAGGYGVGSPGGAGGAAEGSGRDSGDRLAQGQGDNGRQTRAATRAKRRRETEIEAGPSERVPTGARENVEGETAANGEVPAGMERANEIDEWVEDIPVNSILLAAKSDVLRTMLSNGMRESDKSAPVVIKVNLEEKEAFKEMLHFIYAGTLSAHFSEPDASIRLLVDLLIVGDKFEVGSLLGAVLKVLAARDQTVDDSVVLALDIPEALELHSEIKALVEGARKYLLETFKDAEEWDASLDFLRLREDAVGLLLESDELEASLEDRIFDSVLVWLRNNHEGLQERQEAMRRLSQHIRFGCISGERLVRIILKLPEMALPEVQQLVKFGIYYRASPDHEKIREANPLYLPRKGILGQSIEILSNFMLDEGGRAGFSQGACWQGSKWRLQVMGFVKNDDPSTVGIFLTPSQHENSEAEIKPTKVTFEILARTWPSGLWTKVHGTATHEFKQYDTAFGYHDAFRVSWEEARKSDRFVGCTGELSLKVVLYRKKS